MTVIILGAVALLVGLSKTGVPGLGILQVPLMAVALGAKLSVGTLLPLLLVADIVAVLSYRRDTDWSQIRRLLPWVSVGLVIGAGLLWLGSHLAGDPDATFRVLIGATVLVMLAVVLIQRRLRPEAAGAGLQSSAGLATGIATTLANAAGPVMTIYLHACGFDKRRFMGTAAWFFLIINAAKLPIFIAITALHPEQPMLTWESVTLVAWLSPLVVVGALGGRSLLPHIPQRGFEVIVLSLAALAAGWLLIEGLVRLA